MLIRVVALVGENIENVVEVVCVGPSKRGLLQSSHRKTAREKQAHIVSYPRTFRSSCCFGTEYDGYFHKRDLKYDAHD